MNRLDFAIGRNLECLATRQCHDSRSGTRRLLPLVSVRCRFGHGPPRRHLRTAIQLPGDEGTRGQNNFGIGNRDQGATYPAKDHLTATLLPAAIDRFETAARIDQPFVRQCGTGTDQRQRSADKGKRHDLSELRSILLQRLPSRRLVSGDSMRGEPLARAYLRHSVEAVTSQHP
jgi:hypothetical protein